VDGGVNTTILKLVKYFCTCSRLSKHNPTWKSLGYTGLVVYQVAQNQREAAYNLSKTANVSAPFDLRIGIQRRFKEVLCFQNINYSEVLND